MCRFHEQLNFAIFMREGLRPDTAPIAPIAPRGFVVLPERRGALSPRSASLCLSSLLSKTAHSGLPQWPCPLHAVNCRPLSSPCQALSLIRVRRSYRGAGIILRTNDCYLVTMVRSGVTLLAWDSLWRCVGAGALYLNDCSPVDTGHC